MASPTFANVRNSDGVSEASFGNGPSVDSAACDTRAFGGTGRVLPAASRCSSIWFSSFNAQDSTRNIVRVVTHVFAKGLTELLIDARHPINGAMQHGSQSGSIKRTQYFLGFA